MSSSSLDSTQEALAKLERLPKAEQLAVLNAIELKRQQKQYIKYFAPWESKFGAEDEQRGAIRKFTGTKKVFGLLGGNRSGKSVLGSFIAVAWCLGKEYFRDEPAWEWVKDLPIPEPPNNVWVVGLTNSDLPNVIWYAKLRHMKTL